jgi:hypothetical protein
MRVEAAAPVRARTTTKARIKFFMRRAPGELEILNIRFEKRVT